MDISKRAIFTEINLIMGLEGIKQEVSKLSPQDLFYLMRHILDKVEEVKSPISEKWQTEIDRRDVAYSWKDVKKQLLSE
jgi:putative addiction module component (TIGR02574 family)